jgi:hypothetical protein
MPCATACQVETVIHAAWLQGKAATPPTTPQEILEAILVGNFTLATKGGKTLVSSSANGRSVSFQVPDGWNSGDVMVLAHEALRALAGMPDPANPILYPAVARRLRGNFNRAITT